jgi:hypothetical protein
MLGLLASEGSVRGMAGLRGPGVGDPAASHKADVSCRLQGVC